MAAMKKKQNALGATPSKNRPSKHNDRSASTSRAAAAGKKKSPGGKSTPGKPTPGKSTPGKPTPGKSTPAHFEKKRKSPNASEAPERKKRRITDGEQAEHKDTKGTHKFEKKKVTPLDRKGRKALAVARKMKRKPDFELEKDIVLLWEKMRQRNLSPEERSSIVSITLEKTKGKRLQMAKCHSTSRVLQACVKYCQESEREEVFQELKPHFLELVPNIYGCHLAQKMLDHAKKEHLQQLISALHGHVVRLVRHPSGSAVVELAYHLANGTQKRELISEFYAPEFRLFKNLDDAKSLFDTYSTVAPSRRKTIFDHMTRSIQPILEKQIVDHSIVHRALSQYLSISPKNSMQSVIEQLSGPMLVRMIHTADGARIGVLCVRSGTAKERKKILKGMKGQAVKVAHDDYGYAVLLSIFDVVDDTELVGKVIISELAKELKDLCLHKYGHRVILHLLSPNTPRYFPPSLQKLLECPIKPFSGAKVDDEMPKDEDKNEDDKDESNNDEDKMQEDGHDDDNIVGDTPVSKKDPSVRRSELMAKCGFAEKLAEACATHAGELLRSSVGKDVIYEVACGGLDGTLTPEGINSVRKAIADLAALPKAKPDEQTDEQTEEHVMEHFYASRTICRLLLDSRCHSKDGVKSFAETLWDTALKGRLRAWAQGHSLKVVTALRDSQDPKLKLAAKSEIQSLGQLLVKSD